MKQISALTVALAVCTAVPVAAQTLTTWDSPVKVTASAGALTKSSGCESCADSGAHSTTQIGGDGYAEFVAPALTRLFAGLGADLTASTASGTINYAFSLWPSGAWEIRELGTYRKEGTYAAGDRFRVAVENGVVVYRRNGTLVYTSKVPTVFPLALDTTLYAVGASIAQAQVATTTGGGIDPPPPPADPTPATTYSAVTDRNIYVKPALPALGPAGSLISDPVFHTPIRRVTDSLTRPGTIDRSYRTPSSPHQNEWSVKSSYFYVMGSGGAGPIPFAFDPATGTARRIKPTTTGDGGLVLSYYIEPQFSYVSDNLIYGSYSGSGSTLRTVDQYDFASGVYSRLIDLDALIPGLAGTYIGGVASSGGPIERIEAFFGGTSQDHHRYVVVFDKANPSNRQILDTVASTINGQPSPVTLNFNLHHVMIDRSGRYVMLYTTTVDQAAPRSAAQEYLWDLQTGTVTELGAAALPYGHDAFGYGVYVNKDCCSGGTWDAGQWQFRALASPLAPHNLVKSVLTPKEVSISDHTTWNNAQPDRLLPVISGLYRYGINTVAWRPWDDEIVGIQTDAPAGTESTVWRFAHHRTDVSYDGDATRVAFWYQPHPNVSQDGKWILFTSNWEKTLGTDPSAEAGSTARQDVFLLQLTMGSTSTASPVAVNTTALPGGRVNMPYSTTLSARGGSGTFVWSVAGTLPAGLTLNAASGVIDGTPSAAGSSTVTVTAADAANSASAASVSLTLAITAQPVTIATTSLPAGRVAAAYHAAAQATGGSGAYTWSIASGSLPGGVTLDASTGALSGTPTTTGAATFTVAVADASDGANAATAAFTITIDASPVQLASATLAGGRVTQAYAAALQATGGTGAYAWSVVSGSLPQGTSLDANTGAIAGTPAAAGTATFVVHLADATDASNAVDAAFTIVVANSPVQVTTAALASSRATLPYAAALVASGGSGAYTWSIVSGTLPVGIVLDAATGTLSGTPAAAGVSSVTVRAVDGNEPGNAAQAVLSLTITAAPVQVTGGALAVGRVSTLYAATLRASGGGGAFRWTLTSGALPAGLSLDSTTGAVAGTPATAGSYSFTASVVDAADATNSATATFGIVVGAPSVRITTTSLAAGRERVAYSASLQAAGGSGTFTWTAVTALPAGLTLKASTGAITGTPTTAGTYSVSVRATDAADASNSTTAVVTVAIAAGVKVVSPRTLPNATAGAAYSYTVLAANVVGTATWNLQGGTLPPGLTLNATTGVVSGVPTTKGTYSFNTRVKDTATNDTLTLTLTVK